MRIETSGVLFDSDGVLIDSHHQIAIAWKQIADEFDLDFATLMVENPGVRAADTFSRYLPAAEVQRAVDRLEDIEVELAPATRPLPGAVELLEHLPVGFWSIVTSGSRRLAMVRWHGAGIPIPPHVITADDVTLGKPNPEPYRAAARLIGVNPEKTLVFEDSPAGATAGRNAGATVIAVGDQPWPAAPAMRIDDLSTVSVDPDGSGIALVFAV
jgi:sugar-phosphatase